MSDTIIESTSRFPELRLKRREEKRLKAGHLWVFSNEIDTATTPLQGMEPGSVVTLTTASGQFLAYAYANPSTLICARILSRRKEHEPGPGLFVTRIRAALELRERLFAAPFYRLVHGESDGLPGLIVDRYGDYLVVQMHTAGIERFGSEILGALEKELRPRGILLRNDAASRELEGLAREVKVAVGEVPDELEIEEGGCRFIVPVAAGQKTGWFYDQRENRERLRGLTAQRTVLDVCSYIGGWAVQAGAGGAKEICCVDDSARALSYCERNGAANGLDLEVHKADAFAAMRRFAEERRRFDVVVIDPPAFVKRRKDLAKGRAGYRKLNELAVRLLARDGVLVSCSCSYHFPEHELLGVLRDAGRHLG
ncbi:MAG: class I SAM-dependent rRNA methyltransferase, partial [Chromatiales bacterium]|nr:class I SAM-dependent rRNA methyltransferase [Chromatiales bacterium]